MEVYNSIGVYNSNSNSASSQARAEALLSLKNIAKRMDPANNDGAADEAHKMYITNLITRFFDNPGDLQVQRALTPPAGSPIGTDLQDWCSFETNN